MADEVLEPATEAPAGAPAEAPAEAPVTPPEPPAQPQPEQAQPDGKKPANDSMIPAHRFNEVYRKMREKERELNRLMAQQPPAPQPEKTPSPPKQEDYANVEDFNRAWVQHEAEQKVKTMLDRQAQTQREEAQAREMQARQTQAAQNLRAKVADAKSRHAGVDFDLAMETVDLVMPNLSLIVAESDRAGDLIAHLGNNPSEAERISRLPYERAIRELGRLEEKLSTVTAPAVKPSNTPAPPTPVAPGVTKTVDLSRMSQKEYNDYMNARVGTG